MKPITTEKAVMMIEAQNILTFLVSSKTKKPELKKNIEEMFKIKVDKVRTLVKGNKKYAYVKLKKEFPAIDVATKLGMI